MAKQIIVTQNDYGIELETQFVDDKKKPLDITDYDVWVKVIYDDKTIDTVLAEHKDSVNGIAYIVLEKEHLINAGLHTSVWSVVDEDEHVTAQENVYYFVKDMEGSEDDTPATDLPIDADGVLDKFNEIDNNLFELTEQGNVVNEEINSINEQLEQNTNKINSITILVTNYKDLVVNNDWTRAINKAIEDCSILGGKVLCPVGTCLISQIKLKSNVILEGNFYKTVLKSIDNNDCDNLIELYDNNTYLTGIRNLYIDGNNGNQNKSIRGVLIDNSNGNTPIYDHHGIYENLYIENTSGEGFFLNNTRENRIKNVQVRKCSKSGFAIYGSDNWLLDCTSAGNKGKGFEIGSYNTKFTTCKAFFNGETNGNSGEGFYLENAHFNQFSNCESQESGSHGIRLVNSHNNIFSSIISDSNGVYNKVDSVGLILEDSSFNNIQISVFSRGNDLQGNQKTGIKINGLSTNNVINAIVNDTKNTGMVYCNITNDEINNKNYVMINGNKYIEGEIMTLPFTFNGGSNKTAFPLSVSYSNGGDITLNVNSFELSQTLHMENTNEWSTIYFNTEIPINGDNYKKIIFTTDYKQFGEIKLGIEIELIGENDEIISTMSGTSGTVNSYFTTLCVEREISNNVKKCKLQILAYSQSANSQGDVEFKNINIYLNKR